MCLVSAISQAPNLKKSIPKFARPKAKGVLDSEYRFSETREESLRGRGGGVASCRLALAPPWLPLASPWLPLASPWLPLASP